MSAPATNPLRFPERSTKPRGFACETSDSAVASSLRTAADSTLVEAPGVSKVSHAMRSLSTSSFQLPPGMAFRRPPDVIRGW